MEGREDNERKKQWKKCSLKGRENDGRKGRQGKKETREEKKEERKK